MEVFFRVESELLTDYIRYLFPPDEKEGLCVVKSSHLLGQLLIAHLEKCLLPPVRPEGEHVIELRIPRNDATQSLDGHFLYIRDADMLRLNMALKACFEMDLNLYYARASSLGFMKKDIVEGFIASRGLVSTDPYDAIHKRVYRKEIVKREQLTKMLIRKVKYIDEALDMSGLPKNTNI